MYAVIRIRGSVGTSRPVKDTMKMLRLDSVNTCTIVPENPTYKGMLDAVKDWITYGEIDKATMVELLKKRLRLKGNKRVDQTMLKQITKMDSFEVLADALIASKAKLRDFEKLQPLFRLTPPSKGFRSTRENYPKGDLGYRGKEINQLLVRMI